MKTALKYAAFVAVAALLAWTGMYLHWHFKIVGAIHALSSQSAPIVGGGGSDPLKSGAFEELSSAGCRSLPYLVGVLDKTNNPELMGEAFLRIFNASLPPSSPDAEVKAHLLLLEENRIFLSDKMEQRQEKAERVRAWWSANGSRYHQSWRVWSSKCSAK
jgi:hypothetical protein